MQIIYIQRTDDKQYLGLNVTNQTTTGWCDTLMTVKALSYTTDRLMRHFFDSVSDMSFEELLEYLTTEKRHAYNIIDIVNDEEPQSYVYW